VKAAATVPAASRGFDGGKLINGRKRHIVTGCLGLLLVVAVTADWAREKLALAVEVVKRTDDTKGFVVLPRRWVVERPLGWLMHSRRLCRDYETLPATSEALIQ